MFTQLKQSPSTTKGSWENLGNLEDIIKSAAWETKHEKVMKEIVITKQGIVKNRPSSVRPYLPPPPFGIIWICHLQRNSKLVTGFRIQQIRLQSDKLFFISAGLQNKSPAATPTDKKTDLINSKSAGFLQVMYNFVYPTETTCFSCWCKLT